MLYSIPKLPWPQAPPQMVNLSHQRLWCIMLHSYTCENYSMISKRSYIRRVRTTDPTYYIPVSSLKLTTPRGPNFSESYPFFQPSQRFQRHDHRLEDDPPRKPSVGRRVSLSTNDQRRSTTWQILRSTVYHPSALPSRRPRLRLRVGHYDYTIADRGQREWGRPSTPGPGASDGSSKANDVRV